MIWDLEGNSFLRLCKEMRFHVKKGTFSLNLEREGKGERNVCQIVKVRSRILTTQDFGMTHSKTFEKKHCWLPPENTSLAHSAITKKSIVGIALYTVHRSVIRDCGVYPTMRASSSHYDHKWYLSLQSTLRDKRTAPDDQDSSVVQDEPEDLASCAQLEFDKCNLKSPAFKDNIKYLAGFGLSVYTGRKVEALYRCNVASNKRKAL